MTDPLCLHVAPVPTAQPSAQPSAQPAPPRASRLLCALLAGALVWPAAQAQPWGQGDRPARPDARRDVQRDHRGDHRDQFRNPSRDPSRNAYRDEDGRWLAPHRHLPAPAPVAAAPMWHDRGHQHDHRYPRAGTVVQVLPAPAPRVLWQGVPYRFHEGVWYTTAGRGHAVVRPPRGVWVSDLPFWRTVVVVGGLTYLYLNGTYYRERSQGGYEVVDAPAAIDQGAAAAAAERVFVYPRNGQGAQQQAADEYDCHRWAVAQTGFDPAASATGVVQAVDANQRADYQRARGACLEGRGYTVR